MIAAAALALAYVSGSIPSAYLAGKAKGIDLRTVGSGNLGATNVYRTLGAKMAAVVFLVDVLKGALPVIILPGLVFPGDAAASTTPQWFAIACGVAAIVGHARPVFLLWKGGGKGVATAAGIFAAIAPVPLVLALIAFALVLWRTGYVSAGSLTAAVVLVAGVIVFDRGQSPATIAAVAVCLFVFWSHRANIERLRAGTEHRFSRAKSGEGV